MLPITMYVENFEKIKQKEMTCFVTKSHYHAESSHLNCGYKVMHTTLWQAMAFKQSLVLTDPNVLRKHSLVYLKPMRLAGILILKPT